MRRPLPPRDYTGDKPCMVYGIGDPSTSGVFVPTDATDRWIRGLPWHPEPGERLDDYGQARCEDLVRSSAGIPRPLGLDPRHSRLRDDGVHCRPLLG